MPGRVFRCRVYMYMCCVCDTVLSDLCLYLCGLYCDMFMQACSILCGSICVVMHVICVIDLPWSSVFLSCGAMRGGVISEFVV